MQLSLDGTLEQAGFGTAILRGFVLKVEFLKKNKYKLDAYDSFGGSNTSKMEKLSR